MRSTPLMISIVATALGGCAADPEYDVDFRSAGDPWTFPAGVPGNGDLTIYEGPVAGNGGGILWDLQGSTVYAGSRDANEPVLVTIEGTEIHDPSGALLCWVDLDGGGHATLYDAEGNVVATEHGRFVFVGDELAIELHHAQAFAGPRSDGLLLGTATEKLHNANKMRTLVYGALFMGECGSNQP